MSREIEIPLFPLNVVLFPFSKLPLYIFEERYKKMINECIDSGAVFGINLFAERKIFLTGCSALVEKVVNRLQGGEMNIITKGINRYKVNHYQLGSEGYYIGKVEFIEEDNLNYDKVKMEKLVKTYNDFVDLVYKGNVQKINLSDLKWHDGKRSVAFCMAEKSGLSLQQRQVLLEINIEDKRLDFILKYFEEVLPKIKEADRISNIIKNNGYIQ